MTVTERELVRLRAVEDAVAELLKAWVARPFDARKTREIRALLATLVLPAAPGPAGSKGGRRDEPSVRLPYTD